MEPFIVAEEPGYLVVCKPPGMHSAPISPEDPNTVLAWAAARYPEVARVHGRKPVEGGLVHRLDRETSGLLLVARTQEAHEVLTLASADGAIRKRYLARCRFSPMLPPGRRSRLLPNGVPAQEWGAAIESGEAPALPLVLRSSFRAYGPGRRLVAAVAGSNYETIIVAWRQVRAGATASVEVEVKLGRGFRHQIRVHLASSGLPILGDPLYEPTSDDAPRESPHPGESGRMFLHADALEFFDPWRGEILCFEVPAGWDEAGSR